MTKDILIQKFMAGTSTHEEEQTLRCMLQEEGQLTTEEQLIASMLELPTDSIKGCDTWMDEDESQLFDEMMKAEQDAATDEQRLREQTPLSITHPPRHISRTIWRVMSVAAVLTGIFIASVPLWKESRNSNMTVTYLYGERMENEELAMDLMHETMYDIFDRSDIETELTDLFN